MKRTLSLLLLTVVATLSFSASAQSLVGKWNTSAGAQLLLMEAAGSKLNEVATTQTFNEDGIYEIYNYVKLDANVNGYMMSMFLEYTESGEWLYVDKTLTYISEKIDFKNLDIEFSNPLLNAHKGEVEDGIKERFEQACGTPVAYGVRFISQDEVCLTLKDTSMLIEFNLTRAEQSPAQQSDRSVKTKRKSRKR